MSSLLLRYPLRSVSAMCAMALCAFALLPAGPAAAATRIVSNCNDSGPGSLRNVVASALGGDTIDLTGLDCHRIGLTSGPIVIPQFDLSLVGPGKYALTVDGNRLGQVFRHDGSGLLQIRAMTITRGFKQTDSLGAPHGGCIHSWGDVELRHARVHDCHACDRGAGNAMGGGIYANSGVSLFDSEIANNRATGPSAIGGGVYADGGVLVRRSRISHNHAQQEGGGVYASSGLDARYTVFSHNTGGAVAAFGNSAIADSTISRNRSRDPFGGILHLHAVGASWFLIDPMIINSTISGNRSVRYTVYMAGRPGSIANSTIVFNEHTGETSGSGCSRYAAVFLDGNQPLQFESNIVTRNACAGSPYYDIGKYEFDTETVLVGANNLVASSNLLQLPPDTISLDPRLAPLANNGGLTRTHALLDDSPAIDMGNNAAGLAYDQRGAGFPRVNGTQADIGAYER